MNNEEISYSYWKLGSNPYYYYKILSTIKISDMIKMKHLLGHLPDYES